MEGNMALQTPHKGLELTRFPRYVWECLLSHLELSSIMSLLLTGDRVVRHHICASTTSVTLHYAVTMPIKWPTILSSFSALLELTLDTSGSPLQNDLDHSQLTQLPPSLRSLRLLVPIADVNSNKRQTVPFKSAFCPVTLDLDLSQSFPELNTLEMQQEKTPGNDSRLVRSISSLKHLTSLTIYDLGPLEVSSLPESLIHLTVNRRVVSRDKEVLFPPLLETLIIKTTVVLYDSLLRLPPGLTILKCRLYFVEFLASLPRLPQGLTNMSLIEPHDPIYQARVHPSTELIFPPHLKTFRYTETLENNIIKALPRTLETLSYSPDGQIPWALLPPSLTSCPILKDIPLDPSVLPRKLRKFNGWSTLGMPSWPSASISQQGTLYKNYPSTLEKLHFIVDGETRVNGVSRLPLLFPEFSPPPCITSLKLVVRLESFDSHMAEDILLLFNERLPSLTALVTQQTYFTSAMHHLTVPLRSLRFDMSQQGSEPALVFGRTIEPQSGAKQHQGSNAALPTLMPSVALPMCPIMAAGGPPPPPALPGSALPIIDRNAPSLDIIHDPWCKNLEELFYAPLCVLDGAWMATAPPSLTMLEIRSGRSPAHHSCTLLLRLPPNLVKLTAAISSLPAGSFQALPKTLKTLRILCHHKSARYTWNEFLKLPRLLQEVYIPLTQEEPVGNPKETFQMDRPGCQIFLQ